MSLRHLRFAQGIALERLVLSGILDLGAFRPEFWAELAKGSARRSLVEWPAEGSDRTGGQMGGAKITRRESNTWLGSNEE